MPLDPALKNLIAQKLANARVPQWQMPIGQVREAFAHLWTPALTGSPVAVRKVGDRALGRVNARVFLADGPANPAILMYFHGGGYVKGGLDETDAFCGRLAQSTGRLVASAEYRLAPEHPFPAALDDAYAATSWASSTRRSSARRVRRQRRERRRQPGGGRMPAGEVTPGDHDLPSGPPPAGDRPHPEQPLHRHAGNRVPRPAGRSGVVLPHLLRPGPGPPRPAGLAALGGGRVRPASGAHHRREAAAYAEKLRSAGVDVTYSCYAGMIHGFLGMGGLVKEAQPAIDEMARFLARG